MVETPQLFYQSHDGQTKVLLAKIVDNILGTDELENVDKHLVETVETLKFETVVHGPGQLRYFRYNLT